MYDPKNNLLSSVDMDNFTISKTAKVLKEFSDVYTIVKDTAINIDKREFGNILIVQLMNDVYFEFITAVNYDKRFHFVASIVNSSEASSSPNPLPYCFAFPLKNLRFLKYDKDTNGAFIVLSLCGDEILPGIYFKKSDGCIELLEEMQRHLVIQKSMSDDNLYIVKQTDTATLERSLAQLNLFSDENNDFVQRFVKSPQSAALSEFAKLTSFMRDTIVNPITTKLKKHRDSIAASENVKSNVKDDTTSYFVLKPTTDFVINVGAPVGLADLCKFNDCEHCRPDIASIKNAIFMNGLSEEVRSEFWKYLIGYFPWDSSEDTKLSISKEMTEKYFKMKTQWTTMLDEQKARNSYFKEMENLISKDVERLDRSDSFYQNDSNVRIHNDILVTFLMYNHDTGYVQGMSDILSVILTALESEVDAFWCFAKLMDKDKMKRRFEVDQGYVLKQLSNLQLLIKFIDHDFAHFLTEKNSINMYFCFRWLIVLFRREFSVSDCMTIWDVLLTELPCKNYELFICLAILLDEKDTIIANDYSFDEILKYINDLALTLDVKRILNRAFSIYAQLSKYDGLPSAIVDIVKDE